MTEISVLQVAPNAGATPQKPRHSRPEGEGFARVMRSTTPATTEPLVDEHRRAATGAEQGDAEAAADTGAEEAPLGAGQAEGRAEGKDAPKAPRTLAVEPRAGTRAIAVRASEATTIVAGESDARDAAEADEIRTTTAPRGEAARAAATMEPARIAPKLTPDGTAETAAKAPRPAPSISESRLMMLTGARDSTAPRTAEVPQQPVPATATHAAQATSGQTDLLAASATNGRESLLRPTSPLPAAPAHAAEMARAEAGIPGETPKAPTPVVAAAVAPFQVAAGRSSVSAIALRLEARGEIADRRELRAGVEEAVRQTATQTTVPAPPAFSAAMATHVAAQKVQGALSDLSTGALKVDEPDEGGIREMSLGGLGSAPTTGQTTGPAAAAAPAQQLAQHAARQLAVSVTPLPDGPVEVSLSPEELGRVRLTVSVTDGVIAVNVQADRPETADLLRRHIDALAREFRDLGYQQSSFSFGQSGTRGEGGSGRSGTGRFGQGAETEAPVAVEAASRPRMNSTDGLDLRL